MSSVTRITGYNSGLDVDSIVTKTMKPYKTKVDTEVQKKKALEYQQEQYQQIMSDASDFYDKYLDILKTGSLMSTATYQTEKYTSTDSSKVTAKGLAGASVDNYTVSVSQLASKATGNIEIGSFLNGSLSKEATINIGKAQIKFDVVPNGYTTVANYNKAIQTEKDKINKAITDGTATAEQKLQLADLDANVIKAQYSEFNGSVSFTASQFGQGGFTLNGTAATDKYLEATIKNGSGKVYSITQSDKKTSNMLTIDNIQFDFKSLSTQASTSTITRNVPADDLVKATALTETTTLGTKDTLLTHLAHLAPLTNNLTALTPLADDATTTIASDGTKTTTNGTKTTTTAKDGTVTTKEVVGSKTTTTVTSSNGSVTITEEDKTVSGAITTTTTKTTTTTPATATSAGTKSEFFSEKKEDSGTNTTTTTSTTTNTFANGVVTTTKSDSDGTTTTTKDGNITTTEITIPYDGSAPISKKIVTDTTSAPTKTTTTMNLILGNRTTTIEAINDGTNTTTTTVAKQEMTDLDGLKSTAMTTTIEVAPSNDLANPTSTTSTTINLKVNADGTTTKKVQTGTNAGMGNISVTNYNSTSLTGETDVTAIKDKLVKFVDDYNTFIKSISTKLYEKRERDYMPLTDEQKKDMSDSQITAWEKKAKAGWLRNDSDLSRITGEMKSAMTTFMSDSGLSLEAIGITPVKDYAEKNGTFTVDEEKLTKALEENAGAVKDLFIKPASGTDNGGALTRLKDAIKSEFKSSYSSLSQKAGLVGSSTEKDNTLTKSISDKKTLIDELNKKLADKENALYKKYSQLETAMQTLNSQQASLTNMLGGSN